MRSTQTVVRLLVLGVISGLANAGAAGAPRAEGIVHYPELDLPRSSLLALETSAALRRSREEAIAQAAENKVVPSIEEADRAELPEVRRRIVEAFLRSTHYKQLVAHYHVTMTPQDMGGVHTEVFVPTEGVAAENERRVLINVHGGGFMGGCRTDSHNEAMPIAAIGKFKVVSIDYRLAPEHAFPAGSEDVAAVYRELLKSYRPENIGFYGSSAGGVLTAEVIAWFQKEGLPRPGAIGMFCGAAAYWTEGDSGEMVQLRDNRSHWWSKSSRDNPYFKDADPNDPLAFPLRSAAVLAKFPPSLLITSTRDVSLSTVVKTHSVLISQGVEAELHVWEGLDHVFYYNPALPESRDAHEVVARFFSRHLGK